MLRKNVLIGAAAIAALAFAGLTRADVSAPVTAASQSYNVVALDDATTMPATTPATSPAPAASAPATPPTPLMGALDSIHVGPALENLGISVTGYVEGSWTYSADPPAGNILADRVFDTKTESLQFDAIDLLVQRSVDYTKTTVDVGFKFEQLYGWDAAYTHSNGLNFYSLGKTAYGGTAAIHPKAQYDLVQADFTIMIPVGHGLGIQGGKFNTLLGYEVIDGPSNQLYSHSFIFDEEPFTHTGLLGIYTITDSTAATQITATGGFTRGWDQATEDNNGSLDYTGQLAFVNTKYSVYLNGITGDETATGPQDGWRTVIDANGTYNVSDQLTLGFNGMYAWQAQSANGGVGGGTGQWYAAAAYAKYVICDQVTFNARGEWFDDQDGAAPTQLSSGITNIPNQFYEVTMGLSITPLADVASLAFLKTLTIRPEGRWDYSDHAAFNGGANHDQWTAAVEANYAF